MHADVASYLQFYTFLIAIIRPAIVIALLSGLWLALRRLTLMPGERIVTWLAVAVPLVLWLGVVRNLAEAGAFQARPGIISPLPIAVAVPVLIGLIGLMSSRRIAATVDAAPVGWLIALQVYRVIGGNFIVLWLYGAVPGVFALPAGIGDMLVGLTAIPVALYLASGRAGGVALAIAWNIFGIADLVDALTLGFLSSPNPLQALALDHPNVLTTSYPTVMTPAFAVPLSLILHGLSLWQVRRRARSRSAGRRLQHGIAAAH
jgi:hypothetical protein